MKKIDCLAFGPHPDDVELFCSGVLIKSKKQGFTIAVADLTQGELSTNGDVKTRLAESQKAKELLGLDYRLNLELPDGDLSGSREQRMEVINLIRTMRPVICLIPYWMDRHPDHEAASMLLKRSIFDAGLKKIESGQPVYRPKTVLYYMTHHFFQPSFIVDITDEMDTKIAAIGAYVSQFSNSAEGLESTYINQPEFIASIKTRSAFLGQKIGVKYGEGFLHMGSLKIDNIPQFFS